MRILVVGGGGREHALVWKLAKNPMVDKLFAVPGNAGIAEIAECFDSAPVPSETMANLCEDLGIELVVVGPEGPLVEGLADELIARGLAVFGPTKDAARIEGSKAWAKEIIAKAGVPAAASRTFTSSRDALAYVEQAAGPYVIKADGLAAGKGVTVTESRADAERAIGECFDGRFGDAGSTVVIEEFLEGEELSVFCLSDGDTVLPLAEAQDFKRVFDEDRGPNTGGMGSYSPVPGVPGGTVERVVDEIVTPVVRAMKAEGVVYRGLLYTAVMVTETGPKVFEFNCRFGDPETQVILPRLESDLGELLGACAEGNLKHFQPVWSPKSCVSVVLASAGYPGDYGTGKVITGLGAAAARDGIAVFHAGTAFRDGAVVTAGGRVLAVSALGDDIADARARAYDAASLIEFEGKQFRTDIAAKAGRER